MDSLWVSFVAMMRFHSVHPVEWLYARTSGGFCIRVIDSIVLIPSLVDMGVLPIKQFAPFPVIAPPTPAVFIPPTWSAISHLLRADESDLMWSPKISGANSSKTFRTFQPHDAAKSAS
jgi:hypothetical protein